MIVDSRLMGRLAATAVTAFLALLVILHGVSFPLWPAHMSLFANSPQATVWNAAMLGLAVGLGLLALALPPSTARGHTAGRWMMGIGALATVLMVIYPTDRMLNVDRPTTLVGELHDTFATGAVCVIVAAIYLLAGAARLDARLRDLVGPSYAAAHVAMVLGLMWLALDRWHLSLYAGFVQRGLAIVLGLWLLGVSARIANFQWVAHIHVRPAGRD